MAKAPVAGLAKTRLAKEIGVARAVGFARVSARAAMVRLASDSRWETSISVAPDAAVQARIWPAGLRRRFPQGQGDLGQRMQRIMDLARPGPVIIIGTDIPSVQRGHIAAAFRRLASADAVLGPAGDGGYWLVGLRRRPRILRPFGRVRWSSSEALADTLRNLCGHSVAFAAELTDVDDAESLQRNHRLAGRVVLPR